MLYGIIPIFACLYFFFISKYWLWFQVFGFLLNLLVVVAMFWVPESPKWLLGKRRYNDAREVL